MGNMMRAIYKIQGTTLKLPASTEATRSVELPDTYATKDVAKARSVLDRLLQEAASPEVSSIQILPTHCEEL